MSKYNGVWKNGGGDIMRVAYSREERVYVVHWVSLVGVCESLLDDQRFTPAQLRRKIRQFGLEKEAVDGNKE